MIKKLREVKFEYDRFDCEVNPNLVISQYDIVNRPKGNCKVYLTKREAKSLYTFLKKVFE